MPVIIAEARGKFMPDSVVKPKSAGSEVQYWSNEGVRLRSFKMVLRSLPPSR